MQKINVIFVFLEISVVDLERYIVSVLLCAIITFDHFPFFKISLTYPDFFGAGQYIHQTHEGMTMIGAEQKNSKFVSSDALKLFSLALPVLSKTISKLLKCTLWNTFLPGWFSKNPYIQIKYCMAITFWELQSDLSWKDAADGRKGITRSSVNF